MPTKTATKVAYIAPTDNEVTGVGLVRARAYIPVRGFNGKNRMAGVTIGREYATLEQARELVNEARRENAELNIRGQFSVEL